ncbi:MAG: P-loop NTPase, partial [Candidatus Lambdaproteobacteria bacterium]|nr:P-loop NTPase [Candidatus Lambdaproteobacteria bacterium]
LIQNKEILAIGGGKGGVGKSLLASNLGILLAKSNRNTILIDADLGGANLHTCLGIPAPEVTFSDFVNHPTARLDDVILRTSLENLSLISGAQDFLGIANPKYSQKLKITRAIQKLNVDYVILDLGAGTSFNTLDFFLMADKGVIVVLPEPTSIENAYRFIKSAYYRKLKQSTSDPAIRDIVEQAMDKKNDLGLKAPGELLEYIARMNPSAGRELEAQMASFRPRIVLNQVRSMNDVRIGFSMQNACMKYFGVKVDFVGYLENDDQIWQSIRKRQPIALNGDYLKCVRNLRTISFNLLGNHELKPE